MSSTYVNISDATTLPAIAAVCLPLLQEPLAADDAEHLATPLTGVADPARLRLLSLIQAQPEHEACDCHLTEPPGLSQPTASHHLKVLLQAGLVEREQRGSWPFSGRARSRSQPCASYSPRRSGTERRPLPLLSERRRWTEWQLGFGS